MSKAGQHAFSALILVNPTEAAKRLLLLYDLARGHTDDVATLLSVSKCVVVAWVDSLGLWQDIKVLATKRGFRKVMEDGNKDAARFRMDYQKAPRKAQALQRIPVRFDAIDPMLAKEAEWVS